MHFDNHRENYADLVNESIRFSGLTIDFFIRAKARHLIEAAGRDLSDPSQARVLDVGCGLGLMHRYLVKTFGQITGVDVAPETVEMAKKANPAVRYQSYDGENLPFEDGSFDLVFAVCVLHHVPPSKLQRFADEMARVTAKGGMVAIFEHNPNNPLTRCAVDRCELDKDAVLLPASRVRSLLRQTGLARIRSRHIIFAPVEGRLAACLDRILGRFPVGAQYFVAATKA
jgi:SAM-dependent methyltransferase